MGVWIGKQQFDFVIWHRVGPSRSWWREKYMETHITFQSNTYTMHLRTTSDLRFPPLPRHPLLGHPLRCISALFLLLQSLCVRLFKRGVWVIAPLPVAYGDIGIWRYFIILFYNRGTMETLIWISYCSGWFADEVTSVSNINWFRWRTS